MNPQATPLPPPLLWSAESDLPGAVYRWNDPQYRTVIDLSLAVVDRLLADALQGFGSLPRRGSEVGGLLLGRLEVSEGRNLVSILDFENIPCDYTYGPSYVLSPWSESHMAEALARRRQAVALQLMVVGFYRSHTRKDLFLSAHDQAFLAKHFPHPASVFLLIKPFLTRKSEGAYFLWETMVQDAETPAHRFPFCQAELLTRTRRPGLVRDDLSASDPVSPEFPLAVPSSLPPSSSPGPRSRISHLRALRCLEYVEQETQLGGEGVPGAAGDGVQEGEPVIAGAAPVGQEVQPVSAAAPVDDLVCVDEQPAGIGETKGKQKVSGEKQGTSRIPEPRLSFEEEIPAARSGNGDTINAKEGENREHRYPMGGPSGASDAGESTPSDVLSSWSATRLKLLAEACAGGNHGAHGDNGRPAAGGQPSPAAEEPPNSLLPDVPASETWQEARPEPALPGAGGAADVGRNGCSVREIRVSVSAPASLLAPAGESVGRQTAPDSEPEAAAPSPGVHPDDDPVAPLLQMLAEVSAQREERMKTASLRTQGRDIVQQQLWRFRGKWLPLLLLVAMSGAVLGYFAGRSLRESRIPGPVHRVEQVVSGPGLLPFPLL